MSGEGLEWDNLFSDTLVLWSSTLCLKLPQIEIQAFSPKQRTNTVTSQKSSISKET